VLFVSKVDVGGSKGRKKESSSSLLASFSSRATRFNVVVLDPQEPKIDGWTPSDGCTHFNMSVFLESHDTDCKMG